MKIRENLKKFKTKKSVIIVACFALLCLVGAANNMLHNESSLTTSSEYKDYEESQERIHDGEVLVDSLGLTGIQGTSSSASLSVDSDSDDSDTSSGSALNKNDDDNDNSTVPTETSIVSSDNLADFANTDEYFQEVRASVTLDRNEIISMLTDVIEETDTEAEKSNATQQKLKIIEYMNMEKECENLIRNKGFTDAFVLITDKSVNVTLCKQDITESDAAKVLDIVMRQTGRSAGEIIVQSKY